MKRQELNNSEDHKNINPHLAEDRLLWRALKLGDTIALKELFNKYYNDLFFYGLKLVGDRERVSDEIQDLFANICEKRKSLSEVTFIKAYLFTSLRNNLLKISPRDIYINNEIEIKNCDFYFDISPEEIYLDNETIEEKRIIIEEILKDLSPKQKEIVYLKFYNNYTNIEIGIILSIKQQSVANLLTRTLKTLRKKQKKFKVTIF